MITSELIELEPDRADTFRPGALHEFEVIAVIHDAPRIRVFIVDPHRPVKRGISLHTTRRRHQNNSSWVGIAVGGFKPKCR